MAEQTLGDRDERLAANFDGTEFTECFPTSQGVSFRSKLGTAASRDVTDFVETANAPSDSSITTITEFQNDWDFRGTTNECYYIKRFGIVSLSLLLDGSSATGTVILTLPSGYRPAGNIRGVAIAGAQTSYSCTISNTGPIFVASEAVGQTSVRFTATFPVL